MGRVVFSFGVKVLESQIQTLSDRTLFNNSVYGIEEKSPSSPAVLPIYCCTILIIRMYITIMLLEKSVKDYTENDKFDVILMNPPYGGSEIEQIKKNFPTAQSSETADLFMSVIMYRLKQNGRAAVVLPDGFCSAQIMPSAIRKAIENFNLHTIIRLPHSVFACSRLRLIFCFLINRANP